MILENLLLAIFLFLYLLLGALAFIRFFIGEMILNCSWRWMDTVMRVVLVCIGCYFVVLVFVLVAWSFHEWVSPRPSGGAA